MRRPKNILIAPHARGFTLMEVLLASVVLAGGLVIALAALGGARRNLQAAEHRQMATELAHAIFVRRDAGLALTGESGVETVDQVDYDWLIRSDDMYGGGAIVSCSVRWRDLAGAHSVVVRGLVRPQPGVVTP